MSKTYTLPELHKCEPSYAELQSQLAAEQEKNKRLKGEKPIPFAWWKDCPGLAQKTMERTIERNERLLAINDDLVAKLAAEQEKNKWLHDSLEVCESCGNTTKIDDENYLLWCKTCWEKVVFENKRLREALEKIAGSNWLGNTRLTAEQALKGENEPDGKAVNDAI